MRKEGLKKNNRIWTKTDSEHMLKSNLKKLKILHIKYKLKSNLAISKSNLKREHK